MAITIKGKKAEVAAPVAEAPAPTGFTLPVEIQEEVSKLSPELQAQFAIQAELTPDFVMEVAENLPETLVEALIEHLETKLNEQLPDAVTAPAEQVTAQEPVANNTAASAKAKRDALKAEIAGMAKTSVVVDQKIEPVKTKAATQEVKPVEGEEDLGWGWNSLFPVNQAVTVINRGNGKFEVHVGAVKAQPVEKVAPVTVEAPTKKAKKPSVKTIFGDIQTDEYRKYLETLKNEYPTLDARITWAESIGLVRGTDWVSVTKAGQPMPSSVENMYLSEAIRNKLGIETYIEGAKTKEERKKIANGELPLPTRN